MIINLEESRNYIHNIWPMKDPKIINQNFVFL